MGGGFASTSQKTGHKTGPYFPEENRPPDTWPNPKSPHGWYIREQSLILQSFMSRCEWWKMENMVDHGNGVFERSEPGRQYLFLIPSGKSNSASLPAGKDLPVVFYDIHSRDVKGTIQNAPSTSGAERLTLKAGDLSLIHI